MYFVEWLRGCCLSENAVQGNNELPTDQVSQYRNSKPVRLLPLLVHVVPAALIQFMDFVTDLFVLHYFYNNDGFPFFGAWKVGIAGILLSILAAWYNIIFYAGGCESEEEEACLTTKEVLIISLLAPINLHVLGIGVIFANAVDEKEDRAESVYRDSFLWLKHHESSFEGVPMALITIGAIVTEMDVDLNKKMMFYSSLILTLMSISYGIFGQAANIFKDHIGDRRSQLFICMTVHELYLLLALGICCGSPELGIFRLLIPCALILLSCG